MALVSVLNSCQLLPVVVENYHDLQINSVMAGANVRYNFPYVGIVYRHCVKL